MLDSIGQLRKEIHILKEYNNIDADELEKIADAIEREVEGKYIELPKDADGECIHIGDELDCGKVFRLEIASDGDHKAYVETSQSNPQLEGHLCKYVHHRQTTVEDVLEKFASERIKLFLRMPMAATDEGIEEYLKDNNEACEKLIAEFAAKLQLREAK